MADIFRSYWWLLFPIGFFVFGAWDRWLSYQRSRDHLELLKSYAAQGKEPPPELMQYLRAPVMGHTLWVTRQHDEEKWPCGTYPTQSSDDQGLTAWIADDESLVNTDVVLWYVFGIHHITRIEDWPVMPVDTVSFWLKPFGFFDRNPALDVPPSPHQHHPDG